MYSRITHYQFDTAQTDAMLAQMDSLKQQIQAIPGISICVSNWREDGNGVTVAVYNSQEEAEAAAETVQGIWASMGQYLTSTPSTEVYSSAENLLG